MILHDEILIDAAPDEVYAFFEAMDANYLAWHRDHVCFRWIDGHQLHTGAVAYFEEYINGELLKKQVQFTTVLPDTYIEFVPTFWLLRFFLPRLSFALAPQPGGCLFRAEIHLRIGPLGRRANRAGLEAVRQHMREEGENLKRLVEQQQHEG